MTIQTNILLNEGHFPFLLTFCVSFCEIISEGDFVDRIKSHNEFANPADNKSRVLCDLKLIIEVPSSGWLVKVFL